MQQAYQDPQRYQKSIITPLEKRTLAWFARHMPGWVQSDHLTILGFAGMILAGFSYWLAASHAWALLLVNLGLVLNWFGDSMDGTVARLRNKQRPRYGFYVDHVIDSFGALFLLGGLSFSGYMDPHIAGGLLICYLLFSIDLYLATFTIGTFRLSLSIFGPTELRILLIIGNIVLLLHPMATLFGHSYRLFDVGGILSLIGLSVALVFSVIRNTRWLYQAERV